MFVDSHCHLSDARIYAQSAQMVERALESGVKRIALGGVEPAEWKRQLELKNKFPEVLLTNFGIHPWQVDAHFETPELLEKNLKELNTLVSKCDGVGETGLDFGGKRNQKSFETQERYFLAHLKLAIEHQKPVVLHLVKSHERALEILRETTPIKMVLHRYSGSVEQMKQYLELGAYISFSGEFALEGRDKAKKALLAVPLERLLIETDAPDQGSEPAVVNDYYRTAARMRDIEVEDLMQRIAENFAQIY